MVSVTVTGSTSSILLVQFSETSNENACKYKSSVIQQEVVSCVFEIPKCDVKLDHAK